MAEQRTYVLGGLQEKQNTKNPEDYAFLASNCNEPNTLQNFCF